MFFFEINFFKNSFRNTVTLSNYLDPDQDRFSIGPDLGPNCLLYQQTTKVDAAGKELSEPVVFLYNLL